MGDVDEVLDVTNGVLEELGVDGAGLEEVDSDVLHLFESDLHFLF